MTTMEKPREEPSGATGTKSRRGRTLLNLAIGAVVLIVGLVLIFGLVPGGSGGLLPGSEPTASSAPSDPAVANVQTVGAATPTKVTVPEIGASSSLIATGLQPDGEIEVPPVDQPMQASWYNESPTPGEVGPAVVLGHVNGNGQPGIFAELNQVAAGQEVLIDRADGTQAVFKVSRVDTFKKDSFPTDLVYNDTQNAQLRLITCGGEYDAANRSYLSNVIVYADLVDVRPI